MTEIININRNKRESALSSEQVEKLYQEAEKEMEAVRPKMEDFYDDFPLTRVLADVNKTVALEEVWATEGVENRNAKKKATLAEYALYKYLATWSHGKINAKIPSKFDDFVKGIDLILEFPEAEHQDNRHHALSIDVVLGSDEKFIEKLMIVKFLIDDGTLKHGPRYFRADQGKPFSGFMPQGIVSLSREAVESIFTKEQEGNTKGIEESIVPYVVAVQLLEQYAGFEVYARSVGQHAIADRYKEAHNDLEDATSHLMAELAFNKKMNDVVESVPAIRNTRIFFKELASGQYLEDAKKILEDEKKYAKAA